MIVVPQTGVCALRVYLASVLGLPIACISIVKKGADFEVVPPPDSQGHVVTLAYKEIMGVVEIGTVPFTEEVPAGYILDKDRVRKYCERNSLIRAASTRAERTQRTGPFVTLPTSMAAPPTQPDGTGTNFGTAPTLADGA